MNFYSMNICNFRTQYGIGLEYQYHINIKEYQYQLL